MMALFAWLLGVIGLLVGMGFAIWYNPIAAVAGIILTVSLFLALICMFVRAFEELDREVKYQEDKS